MLPGLAFHDALSVGLIGGEKPLDVYKRQLKDKVYPLTVKLHYAAYPKENVIKAWSEISHKEMCIRDR